MTTHDYQLNKIKQEEISKEIDLPKISSIWKHYKGEYYRVEGFVMREATEEIEICYSSLYKPLPYPWCRPLSEWNDLINYNQVTVKRFTEIKTPEFTHCERNY